MDSEDNTTDSAKTMPDDSDRLGAEQTSQEPILLSILIPSLPERLTLFAPLAEKLRRQTDGKPAELLVLTDNRKWSCGAKRNWLMQAARGTYLCHLDDDDDVADDYVDTLLSAIQGISAHPPDVICFSSQADLGDDMPFTVTTSLSYENEQSNVSAKEDGTKFRADIKRLPWHWCAWRSEIARKGIFPEKFYGEDWHWLQQVIPLCSTELVIDRVLHYYFHRPAVSLS